MTAQPSPKNRPGFVGFTMRVALFTAGVNVGFLLARRFSPGLLPAPLRDRLEREMAAEKVASEKLREQLSDVAAKVVGASMSAGTSLVPWCSNWKRKKPA